MSPSISLNRRFAFLATMSFLFAAYQLVRTTGTIEGELQWIPQTTAPPWVKIAFHSAFGIPAAGLCIFYAGRAIASMQTHITPFLSATNARQEIVSKRLARYLPPEPNGGYTLHLQSLGDWRWWVKGLGLFLMTSLPYWLLLATVGHIVAVGPSYVAIRIVSHLPWQLPVISGGLGLAILAIRRKQRHRTPSVDRPAMLAIAFNAGTENWTNRQLWQVSIVYSLWLQKKGVLPLLALVTAIPTQRLLLANYRHQIRIGKSRDEALSYILTFRTARLMVALAFYALLATVKLWLVVW